MAAVPIRQRLPAWLRRAALALAIVYVAYLVPGNLLINTPLGPALANRQPEKFQADWSHGYTWWPGRAHLWHIRLEGRVARTGWRVEAEDATGRVRLLPLLRRRVEVPWIVADGVDVQVDPLAEAMPRPAPREGGWTLQFDRASTGSLRSARLGRLVLAGQGSAEAGFSKQLRGGPLEIMPSRATFSGARLRWGDTEVLTAGELDATFALARHTRAEAAGVQAMRLSNAHLRLEGRAPGVEVLAQSAPTGIKVSTVPGQGEVAVDIGWTRGQLDPGGEARVSVPVHSLDFNGLSHRNRLEVDVAVDEDLHLTARTASPATSGAPAAVDESVEVTLDADLVAKGRALPLEGVEALVERTSGHARGRWQFPSLVWLQAFLPRAAWLAIEGEGRVDVDVAVVDGRLSPDSRVEVPRVTASATVMGNRIEGVARLEATLASGPDGALLPRASLRMARFRIADADARDRAYVEGRDLLLDVESDAPIGGLRSAGATGALQQARDHGTARVRFSDAHVPDLTAYNRFLPGRQLRFEGGSGTVGGDLRIAGDGSIHGGSLRIRGQRARLRMADLALSGDVDLDARLARGNLLEHTFDLDGSTLHLSNVDYTEPSGDTIRGWWTRIAFDDARVDWDRPMDVSGHARIAMRDVGFLLSLYSRRRDYPRWISHLAGSGQAQVTGRMAWKGESLVFDRLHADNGRYELRARMKLHGQQRSGSLYAKWGVLDCAIALDNGKREFHLVRSRRWYEAQPDVMP